MKKLEKKIPFTLPPFPKRKNIEMYTLKKNQKIPKNSQFLWLTKKIVGRPQNYYKCLRKSRACAELLLTGALY